MRLADSYFYIYFVNFQFINDDKCVVNQWTKHYLHLYLSCKSYYLFFHKIAVTLMKILIMPHKFHVNIYVYCVTSLLFLFTLSYDKYKTKKQPVNSPKRTMLTLI